MSEDRFAELEDFYEDLSSNGKWLIDEVRRLRADTKFMYNERQRLASRLNDAWARLAKVARTESPDLLDKIDSVISELQQLRGAEHGTTPLSVSDRVGQITENAAGRVYDKQACQDIMWLVREIGNTRSLIKWVNQRLLTLVWVNVKQKENTREIVEAVVRRCKGSSVELQNIHDILAEALGYKKAPTAEEDPNCPCPGEYITGEHTAETLAAQAARLIKNLQMMNTNQKDTIAEYSAIIHRLTHPQEES